MMVPNMGIAEVLVSCIVAVLGLAFPVGVIYLLFIIYKKLVGIEEWLKKNKDN